ncbi:MAG: hypothetical protein KDH48_06135 [Rhodoferax sp.]|nr:hypothetical protein [Rhodoferax sp.]
MQRQPVIALVNPDNLIGPLLERWLADAGFAVMVVAHHHGRLAVTADAIVANVTTRRQALILARSQQAPGGVPLILTSPLFRRDLSPAAVSTGPIDVHAVLPIPFSRAELLAALRTALGQR